MADNPADLLPPESRPPSPTPAPARSSALTCEFCECRLAPSGDVLRTSERAKHLRELDDLAAKQTKAIEKLEARIRELEAAARAAAGGHGGDLEL